MFEKEIEFEITNNIIDGAVINAGTPDASLIECVKGYADTNAGTKMRLDTIIDLASITKALATSTALLICNDDGLIDFDTPFKEYLPEYIPQLENAITVRDLAMHVSGFGQQDLYNAPHGRELRANMLSIPPSGHYGKIEYSCWNFQLLGMIVEKVTDKPLPDFCNERIFKPLNMSETSLGNPVDSNPERLSRTCGTEQSGQISDFIAFRLYRDGLTAGNAGAFSTAPDLALFCQCILREGEYSNGKRLFSRYCFDAITTPRVTAGEISRSLGWIVKDEMKPHGFSEHTIYHSGWSGQTVFIDLERQLYAIVLTIRRLEEYERAKIGRFKIIEGIGRDSRLCKNQN